MLNISILYFYTGYYKQLLYNLDISHWLVQFRVQWGQLINGRVESWLLLTQYLTEEEWCKWAVNHNTLESKLGHIKMVMGLLMDLVNFPTQH